MSNTKKSDTKNNRFRGFATPKNVERLDSKLGKMANMRPTTPAKSHVTAYFSGKKYDLNSRTTASRIIAARNIARAWEVIRNPSFRGS
jgi:hypothetical protein